jgi:hypothetical protein
MPSLTTCAIKEAKGLELSSKTPQRVVRDLVKGGLPSRPLFIPIVFTLGVKVENIPIRAFLSNPTKIVLAIRELQKFLRNDGVVAYFDTTLEAEACGCTLDWGHMPPKVVSHLPKDERSFAEISQKKILDKGRIPVAVEVIKRLKFLIRGGEAIVSSITGPLTLPFKLWGDVGSSDLYSKMLEAAGSIILQLARAFCEAGVNVLLIVEESLPELDHEFLQGKLHGILSTLCNVAKYYEVLAALMIRSRVNEKRLGYFLNLPPPCFIFCNVADLDSVERLAVEKDKTFGLPLPLQLFNLKQEEIELEIRKLIPKGLRNLTRCCLVTTEWEVPQDINLESFNENIKIARRSIYTL